MFRMYSYVYPGTKNLESTSTKHWSDSFASDWYLINGDDLCDLSIVWDFVSFCNVLHSQMLLRVYRMVYRNEVVPFTYTRDVCNCYVFVRMSVFVGVCVASEIYRCISIISLLPKFPMHEYDIPIGWRVFIYFCCNEYC